MKKWMMNFSFLLLGIFPAWVEAASSQILATLEHVDHEIQKVSFDDSGRMVVTYWENNCLSVKQLAESTSMRMAYLASTLADADIVTETKNRACLVIIDPRYVFDLSVKSSATDASMKSVLTLASCALPSYTHPENPQLLLNAHLLKEVLWTLAHEARCRT
jgi:hypothetical protein